MEIKYTNIFPILQGPPKFTKIAFFALKICHLATLVIIQTLRNVKYFFRFSFLRKIGKKSVKSDLHSKEVPHYGHHSFSLCTWFAPSLSLSFPIFLYFRLSVNLSVSVLIIFLPLYLYLPFFLFSHVHSLSLAEVFKSMVPILRLLNLQLQRQRCSTYTRAFFSKYNKIILFPKRTWLLERYEFLQRWSCNSRS
jgi:hypothetical protein